MFRLNKYSKAIAAFVSTAAAGVLAALLLGSDNGGSITLGEWVTIASTTVLATLAVFAAPKNAEPGAEPAQPQP